MARLFERMALWLTTRPVEASGGTVVRVPFADLSRCDSCGRMVHAWRTYAEGGRHCIECASTEGYHGAR